MPTYDYRCDQCDHSFECYQPITAKPLRRCPKCGRNSVKRLIGTGGGVIFKGSGFYQTDYRSSDYQKAAKAETTDGAGSGSEKTKSEGTESSTAKPKKTKPSDSGKSSS